METFFLACFVFGLLFTLVSLVLGAVGGVHIPHIGHAGGAAPHVGNGSGGAHVPHVGHDGGAAHGGHAPHASHETGASHQAGASHDNSSLPLLNASSIVGGLTWFGAAGYLLTRLGAWAVPLAALGALAVGALGWYLIARYLGLILQGEVEMDPEDYRLVGTLSHVSVGIPSGGTGEIMFEKAGSRRSEAARALAGVAIPRGSEVVITAYADGFATVQPWSEFLAEREQVRTAPPAETSLAHHAAPETED